MRMVAILRRLAVAGVVVAAAAGLMITTTSGADATVRPAAAVVRAASVPPGLIVVNPAKEDLWYCHYLPNGNLCLRYINGNSGVDIHYDKLKGGTIEADFSYVDVPGGAVHPDDGYFYESAGQTKSFAWINSFPDVIYGQMAVVGQTTFYTPELIPCFCH